MNLASVFTPDVVVLSGGVASEPGLGWLLPAIGDVLRRHAVMVPTTMPVVAATAGDDAGAMGAAYLAFATLGVLGARG